MVAKNEAWYPGEAGVGGVVASRASTSAVSWGAVLAGATAAAALSLILLLLGAGLGLSAVSPWANDGASAATLGVAGIVWLAFTQLAASGLGGYLAGRLRVRWRDTDVDEVHFRDTAHGMLSWAVATLFTAAVLTASVGAIAGIGVKGAAVAAGTAATGAAAVTAAAGTSADDSGMKGGSPGTARTSLGSGDFGYYVDTLLRPSATATTSTPTAAPAGANPATLRAWPDASMVHADEQSSASLNRLLVRALRDGGTLSPEDTQAASQLVAQRTGLSQAEAQRRVTETLQRARAEAQALETRAREAADAARKTALTTALWMVVALLIGAFTASLLATVGGRQRDLID
ncbi:hypothetical protein [Mitsuaria sp. 7]|uniref:hypothetical protein n=1 Tax=Mitsuaria sp. 7 TaxID=1658665 RepID=UPI0007DD86DD|nr:hypothetical protein [Mitsuaria sp. 7]ANH68753.1 hypothetical protein ABE85_16360 [Mitsuaria sp. 7]